MKKLRLLSNHLSVLPALWDALVANKWWELKRIEACGGSLLLVVNPYKYISVFLLSCSVSPLSLFFQSLQGEGPYPVVHYVPTGGGGGTGRGGDVAALTTLLLVGQGTGRIPLTAVRTG